MQEYAPTYVNTPELADILDYMNQRYPEEKAANQDLFHSCFYFFENKILVPRKKVQELLCGCVDNYPGINLNILSHTIRRVICQEFTFAIPCQEAIDVILSHSKKEDIVEIGSGTGYWASILDILATDIKDSGHINSFGQTIGKFHPVVQANHLQALQVGKSNVFMCWPSMDSWSEKVVRAMRPKSYLFLIAEGNGGCCGTEEMFDYIENNFDEIEICKIPQWYGIHDCLQVYKKR